MLITELTYKDLRLEVDAKSLARSKKLGALRYRGLSKSGDVVMFSTPSQTTKGKFWSQYIQLLELEDVRKMKDLTAFQKVTLLIGGDIGVKCTCPAFKYWGYNYILTQVDAVFGRGEQRFPGVRNPELKGSVCKHLAHTLQYFPFYISEIARDMKAKGILTGRDE
jgi:hypothetical protein